MIYFWSRVDQRVDFEQMFVVIFKCRNYKFINCSFYGNVLISIKSVVLSHPFLLSLPGLSAYPPLASNVLIFTLRFTTALKSKRLRRRARQLGSMPGISVQPKSKLKKRNRKRKDEVRLPFDEKINNPQTLRQSTRKLTKLTVRSK